MIIMLILVIRRRTFLRKIVRSPNVEANTVESDDSKCQSPTFTEKTEIEVEIEPEDKGCYFVTLQGTVVVHFISACSLAIWS